MMDLSELVVTEDGQLRQDFMTRVKGCQIVGFVDHVGVEEKYKMDHHKQKNLSYLYIKDTNWVREIQGLEKYH